RRLRSCGGFTSGGQDPRRTHDARSDRRGREDGENEKDPPRRRHSRGERRGDRDEGESGERREGTSERREKPGVSPLPGQESSEARDRGQGERNRSVERDRSGEEDAFRG